MAMERNWKTTLRYRSDEFLSGGAGRQLAFLSGLTTALVAVFVTVSLVLHLPAGGTVLDRAWFYFTRLLDTGTMSGDDQHLTRFVSTLATVSGVVVAGLLISSLAGNFQDRLETIRRTGAPVMEDGHYLILGWSEKIHSLIDQLAEGDAEAGRVVVVVMADRPKTEMEDDLHGRLSHARRVKLVVRSGSSVSLHDLSRVAFEHARAIVVLLDAADTDRDAADGRVIKTLMAIYHHGDFRNRPEGSPVPRVTAEVMDPESQDLARIASGGRAEVVKTNEIISKIILQTSRITGLSVVYDDLLRFEGHEMHFVHVPQAVGRRVGDLLLDFPGACVMGVARTDGSEHWLNPPADRVVAANEDLLLLAASDHVAMGAYAGPARTATLPAVAPRAVRSPENMLVLGWNEKVFPIVQEFDRYAGPGSTLTLVCDRPVAEREALLAEHCPDLKAITVVHREGSFSRRTVLEGLAPHTFPSVMVLGDGQDGTAEAADTRAILALLLLRDFRARAGVTKQEVCSEILDPKNRELAATTEIRDIVISNELVSMVLAQVTHDPRIHAVLDDLFAAEGSEIYLKDLALYVTPGATVSFAELMLAASARGELAIGLQRQTNDPGQRYGIALNPPRRDERFTPGPSDRLIVLAEDDG